MARDRSPRPAPLEQRSSSDNEKEKPQPSPGPPQGQFREGLPSTGYQAIHQDPELQQLRQEDETHKHKIRLMRLVLRGISFIIAILVLIPIAMTVTKFLSTRNVRRTIVNANNTETTRGPWANNTKAWPAYMYLTIASVSVVLEGAVLVAYLKSVHAANTVSTVATYYNWSVIFGHLSVWIVGVILYRQQKDLHGISNDLWGWSCSFGAQEIQKAFAPEVNFNKYCDIQSYSWYAGLVQVGAAILSAFILFLAYRRRDIKKTSKKRETWLLEGPQGFGSPQKPEFPRTEQNGQNGHSEQNRQTEN